MIDKQSTFDYSSGKYVPHATEDHEGEGATSRWIRAVLTALLFRSSVAAGPEVSLSGSS